MKNAIIAGSSGMVGGHLLEYCLQHPEIGKVTSIVRRASGLTHPKLVEVVHKDFLQYDGIAQHFDQQDLAFFCIGVYTGAVDRNTFRQITVDYPVAFANMVKTRNERVRFCLLSGQGADRSEKSRMMFAKDKGAAENQLEKLDMGQFYSFRPGYIYPMIPRKEPNFSYQLMRWLYKPLLSKFGKNMSITSTDLARAMLQVGLNGHHSSILENKNILGVVVHPN